MRGVPSSTTSTDLRERASATAPASPAGPPPMTTTSYRCVVSMPRPCARPERIDKFCCQSGKVLDPVGAPGHGGRVDVYRFGLVALPLYGACHDRGDADW